MTHNDLLNSLNFNVPDFENEVKEVKNETNDNSTDTQATQFGLRSQRIDGGIVC